MKNGIAAIAAEFGSHAHPYSEKASAEQGILGGLSAQISHFPMQFTFTFPAVADEVVKNGFQFFFSDFLGGPFVSLNTIVINFDQGIQYLY
jgi:hypothetical protein